MLHLMERTHVFVSVQKRGLLSLPKAMLARHRLDAPGAQVEVIEREDGVIELHPHSPVPAAQTWFWTDRWQAMEREVDDHVRRGEVTVHESADDFIAHLDRLADDS